MGKAKYEFISEKKLYGNFMNEKIQLGDIFSISKNEFQLQGNLGEFAGIQLSDKKYSQVSDSPEDISSTSKSGSSFSFKGDANANLAKGDFGINFDKNKSFFYSIKRVSTYTLKLATVKKTAEQIWKEQGFDKMNQTVILINVVLDAKSGVLFYTEDSGTKIELKASNNKALTTLGIVAEGNADIVVGKNKTINIIQPGKFQPFFNAVRWRPLLKKWAEL